MLSCDLDKGRRDAIDKQQRNLDQYERGGAAARGGGGGRSAFVPAGGGNVRRVRLTTAGAIASPQVDKEHISLPHTFPFHNFRFHPTHPAL